MSVYMLQDSLSNLSIISVTRANVLNGVLWCFFGINNPFNFLVISQASTHDNF